MVSGLSCKPMVCVQATESHGCHSNESNLASILPLQSSAGVAPHRRTVTPAPVRYVPCSLVVMRHAPVRTSVRVSAQILTPDTRSLIQSPSSVVRSVQPRDQHCFTGRGTAVKPLFLEEFFFSTVDKSTLKFHKKRPRRL